MQQNLSESMVWISDRLRGGVIPITQLQRMTLWLLVDYWSYCDLRNNVGLTNAFRRRYDLWFAGKGIKILPGIDIYP